MTKTELDAKTKVCMVNDLVPHLATESSDLFLSDEISSRGRMTNSFFPFYILGAERVYTCPKWPFRQPLITFVLPRHAFLGVVELLIRHQRSDEIVNRNVILFVEDRKQHFCPIYEFKHRMIFINRRDRYLK